jgi:hypothetical protein
MEDVNVVETLAADRGAITTSSTRIPLTEVRKAGPYDASTPGVAFEDAACLIGLMKPRLRRRVHVGYKHAAYPLGVRRIGASFSRPHDPLGRLSRPRSGRAE